MNPPEANDKRNPLSQDLRREPDAEPDDEPVVDIEEAVMREAAAMREVEPPTIDPAKERLGMMPPAPAPVENLIEGGVVDGAPNWAAPPIRQWPEIDKGIDEVLGEVKKSLALYFPDWVIAMWPTAVPPAVIEALRMDLSRPEAERAAELQQLHTIQIEITWMPDASVQRRLQQGATVEDVGGPKMPQFFASPFTCKGPPVGSEFFSHVAQAILDHGGVQKDPQETLAAQKAQEIADAVAVLKGHGVAVGEPKQPEEMTLERWESMSEPDKARWQKEWAAWEAYRSPGPPPARAAVGAGEGPMHAGRWEREMPPGAPFVPPDAYIPGRERVPPRGRPQGLFGPNGAQPWAIHSYRYATQPEEPEYTTDPEVAMIEQLLTSFQGWGRQDIARVLDYVKARLVG